MTDAPAHHKPAFRRFAAAVGLANLADGIAVVAWAWTASLLTRDPLWIAILPATLRLPWIFFALPSGILADRVDRRRLIMLCDLVRALAFCTAGVALLVNLPLGAPSVVGVQNATLYGTLLGLGVIIGCAEVARDNAAQSMLPAIVPGQELERANGFLGSIETVGNEMAGPALGAFLIALFLPAPFLIIAVALLLAALLTTTITGQFKAEPAVDTDASQGWVSAWGEGFRFVIGHPMLRTLALVTGFWNFFAEMALIALVLHVQENLGAGATTYGLILAVGAVGGVVGGIVVTPLLRRLSSAKLAQWMTVASAPTFVMIALAPGPMTVAAAMFVFYLTGIVWNTISISYRQRIVPDDIRGRVNSVYRLFAWGMMPLGLVASGVIVNGAGAIWSRETALTVPFFVAAVGVVVLAALAWRRLGRGFD